MKTLLILARQNGLAEAIRAVLDPAQYRVIHHPEIWAAEPLFRQATVDACILDAELTDVRPIRTIEQLRLVLPHCPILVYSVATRWEWEEEAYLLGVDYLLTKPVRAGLLTSLLERCWQNPVAARDPRFTPPARPAPEPPPIAPAKGVERPLGALRDFSAILKHSLETGALLEQFLLLLREIIGVNRAAIFLRPPPPPLGKGAPEARLRSACAIGLPPALLEHFELSLDSGIGAQLFRQGRIVRHGAPETLGDRAIQREFELLGVEVAVPILDRETLVGIALFDGRLTGEALASEELALIFHLLEELGLAIRNTWLHDEVTAQHAMMSDTLDQLGNGCVVIGHDLVILHANRTAHVYFARRDRPPGTLDFNDLPPVLGSKVFETMQSGHAPAAFPLVLATRPESSFRAVLKPFHRTKSEKPDAVLLMVEDTTQAERAQRMEIEASSLRLIRTMAEHLAHEIGNALVPLSTSQQLMQSGRESPETMASITGVMADSVQRITRLTNQMQFLARDSLRRVEHTPVSQLIADAFNEAHAQNPRASARLHYESGGQQISLPGERAGLKHALAEVLLNALQATPGDKPVEVTSTTDVEPNGSRWLHIEVHDSGGGFTSETARRATEPFFSTRAVGLGLGLTVTRKIVELHHGRVDVPVSPEDGKGMVRISLPLSEPAIRPGPAADNASTLAA